MAFRNVYRIYKKKMKGPDFIVLGAAKAGTTSLYHYLKQHPAIFIPSKKELRFFTNRTADIDEYLRFFVEKSDKVAGEVSSDYLYSGPDTAKRIKKYFPGVKLIAILRNPIDRAYSEYCMDLRLGKVTGSFADELGGKFKTRYLNQGFYHKQIKRYLKIFDEKQFRVWLYDDLCQDPMKLLQEIFKYIRVDTNFIPNIKIKHNKGAVPKNIFVQVLVQRPNILRKVFRNFSALFFPLHIRQRIRNSIINHNLRKILPMDSDIRRSLLEFYRSDIIKLQTLMNRDLSSWLR